MSRSLTQLKLRGQKALGLDVLDFEAADGANTRGDSAKTDKEGATCSGAFFPISYTITAYTLFISEVEKWGCPRASA